MSPAGALLTLLLAAGTAAAAPSELAPVPAWSAFLGGSGDDRGLHAAVGPGGDVFVIGRSDASWGAPVRAWSGGVDVFVARLDSSGTLVWNTFLGGASTDRGAGIAVGADGSVLVAGGSEGAWGSPVRAFAGPDGFVAKLDPAGNLLWNTFLGGTTSDEAYGVALAPDGGARIVGSSYASWGAPRRPFAPASGWTSAFVAGLDADGGLLWNTFLGGDGSWHHIGYGVAVDADGNVHATGVSQASWGSPVRPWASSPNAFVAKLDPDGDLLWNTFLGATADYGTGVGVDAGGGVLVAGRSNGSWGEPRRPWSGNFDAFVARLDPDGALAWNTFLGGTGRDFGAGIVVDDGGNACVAGESYAAWGEPFDPFAGTVVEAFVARLDANGALLANGFFGGVSADNGNGLAAGADGGVHLVGMSANTWGSPQRPWSGGYDAFVATVAGMLNGPPRAAGQAVSTPEDTPRAVTLTAADPNLDPLTYAVVDPPAHGTLTGVPPSVTYRPAADYAGPDSFTFTARDGVAASAPATVTITVTPVNDPPTDVSLAPGSVPENSPAGTVVGALGTTDADAGDAFTYALADGPGGADNPLFTVVGAELRTAAALDFEAGSARAVRVRATDHGGLSFEKALVVVVTDANDAPTGLALAGGSVAENLPAGAAVGTLSAADQDGGAPAFSLVDGAGGADNGFFAISGSELRTAAPLDHELKHAFSVRVRAEDGGGLRVEREFTVTVLDVNEPPTDLALSRATVAERLPPGAPVGTLVPADPDAGEGFTFAMVAGEGDGDNGAFELVGAEVRSAAVFDRAARSVYSVRLRVADTGGLTLERSFTVTVTESRPPTAIALAPAAIAENAPAGTAVGTLATDDPDGELGLAFALVDGAGGEDNALFTVDGATLRAAQPFDHEARQAYSVRVQATDPGGLSCVAAVAIAVTDANDPPAIEPPADRSVTAGVPVGFALAAADQDGDPLACAMTAGPPGALFDGGGCSFAWTPAQTQLGVWPAVFTVTDGAAQAEAEVALTVGPPLFFDDFSHGTAWGDPDWSARAGKWSVDAKKRFLSSATLKNLALARGAATAALATGRIAAKVTLGPSTNPNATLVFGYRRSGAAYAWRSVTLGKGRITVGTQGGALSTKAAALAVNRRYAVVLDLLADGRVNVSIDGVRRHSYKFPSPSAGQIGLAADLARSYFDDVTVWTPAMLQP